MAGKRRPLVRKCSINSDCKCCRVRTPLTWPVSHAKLLHCTYRKWRWGSGKIGGNSGWKSVQKGGWLRPWVSWPLTTRSQTHFSTLKAHGFHGAYPFHLCSHCDTVCGWLPHLFGSHLLHAQLNRLAIIISLLYSHCASTLWKSHSFP